MTKGRFLRKIIVVAAGSAPAISALILTPLYILKPDSFEYYGLSILFGAILVLLLWLLNILLYYFLQRGNRNLQRSLWWCSSYILVALFTIFLGHWKTWSTYLDLLFSV